jgi:Ca-activated chloride channel family protein
MIGAIKLNFRLKVFILNLLLFWPVLMYSQENKTQITRILFIFDESKSMLGLWNGVPKIEQANRLLTELVDSLAQIPNIQMALRMYGHQKNYPPKYCDDSNLEVPFSNNSAPLIKAKLKQMKPKGTTPIAFSLLKSEKDFPACPNCKNMIILITDGIEECGADPCEVALSLQRNNVIMKPYIIGLGLDVELKSAFDCLGKYLDAGSDDDFDQIVRIIISQTAFRTTMQVDLLDIFKKPTETGVNMTFYDQQTGLMKYNLIHTFNEKGLSDTIEVDALSDYRIVVHTIPQVIIENVKPVPGKHTIVQKSAPQGQLIVSQSLGSKYKNMVYSIKQVGECDVINYQLVDNEEKYLVGKYLIELPTLPRLVFNDIQINQSKLTSLKIPEPGDVSIMMPANGYGSLYQIKDGQAVWLINLNASLSENLTMLPGQYMAVWKPVKINRINATKVKYFEVKSGYSVIVKF